MGTGEARPTNNTFQGGERSEPTQASGLLKGWLVPNPEGSLSEAMLGGFGNRGSRNGRSPSLVTSV